MKNRVSRLAIRIMEKRDIEDVRLLHNDNSVLSLLTDPLHVSEISQEKWFEAISVSRQSKRYVARLLDGDIFVGVFRLDQIDLVNKSVIVGADVIHTYRRAGYATEMFEYFFEYLFLQCGFNRLNLTTLEYNYPARNLYLKLGFQEEGIERLAIFRDGKYQNLVRMSLLATDWMRNP
ncbi:GNAT family N-acetyltransferase [Polynucleobacter victoriensis]|uniref:Protein N-acetyltransferase, RimJ/RimL family n=1 Tax=Polynucleobacter victoriensis TaxID=2049319 RepID=A0A212T8R1_9BURK|nr:GNAT family protein [Polynucleobacter victoriensis]SNC62184.1 Protein N-acetyltransferase, RimJ/RimL family [Polynucleobacter victoriensis]